MRLHKKIYWKISNRLEAFYKQTFKKGSGLLRERKDNRDFKGIGGFLDRFGATTEIKEVNWIKDNYWFNQNPFNCCVFAAFTILMSHQSGIRFSVRWLVKLARREGYISGNGWSFLKAALKCANKYGLLPYELMPDEIVRPWEGRGANWEEYSKWTAEDEQFLTEALKYKISEYRSVSKSEVLKLLPAGYLVFTAVDWYSEMNNVTPPLYLLEQRGQKIGGHAIDIAGWKEYSKRFINPQTFGRQFGENGVAYFSDLWGVGKFSTYVISKLSIESRFEHFKKFYEGRVVRTKENPACYLIKEGKKYGILTEEMLKELMAKIGENKFDGDVKQDVLDMTELGGGGEVIIQNEV